MTFLSFGLLLRIKKKLLIRFTKALRFGGSTKSTRNSGQVNIVIAFPIQYNKGLEEKEKKELGEDYQELEEYVEKLSTNQQELKKAVLYLGAKKVFADTRKSTIENLVDTYKKSDKIDKRYNKIEEFTGYVSDAEEVIASVYPPAGAVIKLVTKSVPIINNLLKKYSLTSHAKKFEDYLREDEKALTLLQKTVNSLQDDQNAPLFGLLSYDQDLLEKDSIFVINEKENNIDLRKSEGGLSVEDMEKVIGSLNNHFQQFVKEFKEKASKYDEKIKEFLTKEDNANLQTEMNELLIKLSIEVQSNNLKELIRDVKDALKSKGRFLGVNKKHQTREEQLTPFFSKLLPPTPKECIEGLKNIKRDLNEELTSEKINNIYQIKEELVKLESELESLRNQLQTEQSSK